MQLALQGLQNNCQEDEDSSLVSIEAILQQIACDAEQTRPEEMRAVASEGISAFQQAYSSGKPLSSTAYASLLSILDSANAWELAPEIYRLYPAQVRFL